MSRRSIHRTRPGKGRTERTYPAAYSPSFKKLRQLLARGYLRVYVMGADSPDEPPSLYEIYADVRGLGEDPPSRSNIEKLPTRHQLLARQRAETLKGELHQHLRKPDASRPLAVNIGTQEPTESRGKLSQAVTAVTVVLVFPFACVFRAASAIRHRLNTNKEERLAMQAGLKVVQRFAADNKCSVKFGPNAGALAGTDVSAASPEDLIRLTKHMERQVKRLAKAGLPRPTPGGLDGRKKGLPPG